MIRLKQPRISPLTRDEVDPALADAFSEGPGRNVIATFARSHSAHYEVGS